MDLLMCKACIVQRVHCLLCCGLISENANDSGGWCHGHLLAPLLTDPVRPIVSSENYNYYSILQNKYIRESHGPSEQKDARKEIISNNVRITNGLRRTDRLGKCLCS